MSSSWILLTSEQPGSTVIAWVSPGAGYLLAMFFARGYMFLLDSRAWCEAYRRHWATPTPLVVSVIAGRTIMELVSSSLTLLQKVIEGAEHRFRITSIIGYDTVFYITPSGFYTPKGRTNSHAISAMSPPRLSFVCILGVCLTGRATRTLSRCPWWFNTLGLPLEGTVRMLMCASSPSTTCRSLISSECSKGTTTSDTSASPR